MGKYEQLRSQVIWAVTHYKIVDTDGIFKHLKDTVENLDTIVQQSLSGSDDKLSSAKICDDFEEGEKCTKGLNTLCGKCVFLSDADF